MKRPAQDQVRTELLAIDELLVLKGKGNDEVYYARSIDDHPDCCPRCGGTALKVQNSFSREYRDYIMVGNTPKIITLIYCFYKFHCLNPECRHIFAPEISFASIDSNVTYRLEKKIVDMVIGGRSYGDISLSFRKRLSRQGVGQIFNRWVHEKDDLRRIKECPRVIGIFTGHTCHDEYALILSCDESIRVLDAMYGVDTEKVKLSIRRLSGPQTEYVLTDCNPTVYEAVKEELPSATHIIPAEMWLRIVRETFIEMGRNILKWVSVYGKNDLILEPRNPNKEVMDWNLKQIFSSRPGIVGPYNDYHNLYDRIRDREFRWNINELDEWPESIDAEFRENLEVAFITYKEYRNEIAAHQNHWEIVPDNLLSVTDHFDEFIGSRHIFSDEALKAVMLHSTEPDPINWQGIAVEKIFGFIERQGSIERNDYDYE